MRDQLNAEIESYIERTWLDPDPNLHQERREMAAPACVAALVREVVDQPGQQHLTATPLGRAVLLIADLVEEGVIVVKAPAD